MKERKMKKFCPGNPTSKITATPSGFSKTTTTTTPPTIEIYFPCFLKCGSSGGGVYIDIDDNSDTNGDGDGDSMVMMAMVGDGVVVVVVA
ncbi:hypothetical protein M0802_013990 [Mischocyttarus mexicanus]|nr:hypothetical protein M0802_013990 [Mischocyttarus mexicanus]